MTKILVLFTGGTIGSFTVEIKKPDGSIEIVTGTRSELKKRNIDVAGREQTIIQKYNKAYNSDGSVEFDNKEIADVLSENMTFGKWNEITDKIRKLDLNNYDGVIITHGTDTLGYFANYMAMILNDVKVPVFLVSSDHDLEDKKANGVFNFYAACEYIKQKRIPGVYVPYRNTILTKRKNDRELDNETRIMYASRVMQCNPLTNNFENITIKGSDIPLATVDNYGRINIVDNELFSLLKGNNKYNEDKRSYIDHLKTVRSNILMVEPFVGIRYNNYNLKDVDAVLHGLYHSGTACTDTDEVNNLINFNRMVRNAGSELYVGPFYGSTYATAKDMIDAGIRFISNTSKENAYVKLVLAYALAPEYCDYPYQYSDFVDMFLNENVNYEHVRPPLTKK